MQIIYEYVTYRVQKMYIYIQWAEEYTFPLGPTTRIFTWAGEYTFPLGSMLSFFPFSMGYDVRITKKIVRKN